MRQQNFKSKCLISQPGAGFTVLELLVVIAIIALLAALTFPVLSKAKARARSAACKNHLNQIGHAMAMYVSDNSGYPSAIIDGQEFQVWADVLTPYCPLSWTNIAWHCPTYIANNGVVAYEKPPPGGGKFVCWTSYAYNSFGIASRVGPSSSNLGLGHTPRHAAHEQQVISPSEMYAVGDSRPFQLLDASGFTGAPNMNPYDLFLHIGYAKEAAPPHSDGYNISFVDGHVDLVNRKDYLFPPRTAHNWNRDNQPHPELWAPTNLWVIQN